MKFSIPNVNYVSTEQTGYLYYYFMVYNMKTCLDASCLYIYIYIYEQFNNECREDNKTYGNH